MISFQNNLKQHPICMPAMNSLQGSPGVSSRQPGTPAAAEADKTLAALFAAAHSEDPVAAASPVPSSLRPGQTMPTAAPAAAGPTPRPPLNDEGGPEAMDTDRAGGRDGAGPAIATDADNAEAKPAALSHAAAQAEPAGEDAEMAPAGDGALREGGASTGRDSGEGAAVGASAPAGQPNAQEEGLNGPGSPQGGPDGTASSSPAHEDAQDKGAQAQPREEQAGAQAGQAPAADARPGHPQGDRQGDGHAAPGSFNVLPANSVCSHRALCEQNRELHCAASLRVAASTCNPKRGSLPITWLLVRVITGARMDCVPAGGEAEVPLAAQLDRVAAGLDATFSGVTDHGYDGGFLRTLQVCESKQMSYVILMMMPDNAMTYWD